MANWLVERDYNQGYYVFVSFLNAPTTSKYFTKRNSLDLWCNASPRLVYF
jgi:hypothetical protein